MVNMVVGMKAVIGNGCNVLVLVQRQSSGGSGGCNRVCFKPIHPYLYPNRDRQLPNYQIHPTSKSLITQPANHATNILYNRLLPQSDNQPSNQPKITCNHLRNNNPATYPTIQPINKHHIANQLQTTHPHSKSFNQITTNNNNQLNRTSVLNQPVKFGNWIRVWLACVARMKKHKFGQCRVG